MLLTVVIQAAPSGCHQNRWDQDGDGEFSLLNVAIRTEIPQSMHGA